MRQHFQHDGRLTVLKRVEHTIEDPVLLARGADYLVVQSASFVEDVHS